jgi:hypothetical protein
MLKDIIEEKQKEVREILNKDLSLDSGEELGAYIITPNTLDTVVAETAQIVAREVLSKVREGVPEEVPSMPDLCIDSHEGWLRSKNTLLDHLQFLEDSLLKEEEINIPGFEGTREDLDKLSIN